MLSSRPEELLLWIAPGANRIPADLKRVIERPQFMRADFGEDLAVDVPREAWKKLRDEAAGSGWWIEMPAEALRQVSPVG